MGRAYKTWPGPLRWFVPQAHNNINTDMASSPLKRVAIITGAAEGIGRAIARRLARDGFDLGLFDLPKCRDLLEKLATSIRTDFEAKAVTVYGDVSVEGDVKGLIDTVVGELGDMYAVRRCNVRRGAR